MAPAIIIEHSGEAGITQAEPENQAKPENKRRDLSQRLAVIARRMRMRFDESVQCVGVTRAHWTLIAAAARIPDATQKSLAQALQISEVSAGRLIDRLCSEGLLDRKASKADRRAYVITPTERARPMLEALAKLAAEQEIFAFQGLSGDDLTRFDHILSLIERNFEPRPAPGTCRKPE